MPGQDIRWKQRFQNYSKAVFLLADALKSGPQTLNDLEKEGAVQRFEYTLELAWKTLRDFLEHSGVELGSVTPKSVVKAAFSARLISDGQLWIDMIDHRNVLSHQCDPRLLEEGLTEIHQRYLPGLQALHDFFREAT